MLRGRRSVGVLALGALVAASAVHADSLRPARSPSPKGGALPRFVTGARWFPNVGESSGEDRLSLPDLDGGLRVVARGLRLIEHPDGRIERAADLLPTDGPLGVVTVPSRMGSGFVFHDVQGGGTRLWRASTWTAPLVPLTRLPFEAAEVDAGFDRLYVVSARTRAMVGLDATTGAIVGEGPLPAAPAYGGFAVSDGWLGAVETDIRGALVTFDAGDTFHAFGVPLASPGVFEQAGRVVLGTKKGAFALSPAGGLERMDGPSADAAFGDSNGEVSRATDEDARMDEANEAPDTSLGGPPLEVAVLRGFPDSPTTAVVIGNSTLARIDLADGRVAIGTRHAVPSGVECQGIRFGAGIGFVCGGSGSGTTIYAYHPPASLEPALSFAEPRVVAPNGMGALAVSGGCPGSPSRGRSTYCVVSADGKTRELDVQGDAGSARVVALSDGSAAVLVPPRFGASGSVTRVNENGKTETHALVLDAMPGETRALVASGLWLDGVVESGPGKVATWVAGSRAFVGVTVGLDGKVLAGTVEQGIERSVVSGPFGLSLDERGGGRETVDSGMTWAELATPDVVDLDRVSEHQRGCTAVGCGVGSWVRVGWGNKGAPTDLGPAPSPKDAKFEPTQIVLWSFDCVPSGEMEGPLETALAARTASAKHSAAEAGAKGTGLFSDLQSSAFRPFLGQPSPVVGAGDLAFDFGTGDQPIQARGYAWGGRDAAWDRTGTWLVRAVDRFSVRRAVWSTAPSRTPFADAGVAAEAFGSEPTDRISSEWRVALDPVEDGGLLFMRTGADTSLAVIERDRAITVVKNASEFSLDETNGTVKVAGRWYLGSAGTPRTFQILGIDAGVLSAVAAYPRYTDDRDAHLVRSVRGDALGIWVIGHGQHGTRSGGDDWFVYPVDPNTHEAGTPIVVSHRDLARAPAPCEPDENGWVLPYAVNPSITKIEFSGLREPPSLGRLEARLVARDGGLCLDSLAAQLDGDPEQDFGATRAATKLRRTVQLALTDRATDRRLGFRCAP